MSSTLEGHSPDDAVKAPGRDPIAAALARLSALQAVTAALSAAATPEEVAKAVVAEGVQVLHARVGAVGMIGTDGETIRLLEAAGLREGVADQWQSFTRSAD